MQEEMIIHERELRRLLECPLRSKISIPEPGDSVLRSTEATCRWLISEIGMGRLPTLQETYGYYYDSAWPQTDLFRSWKEMPPELYTQHYMEGIRSCERLREILGRCEILQKVNPYRLFIDGLTITGEYAVLRSARRKRQGFVLYLRYGGLFFRPLVPDIVSFARGADAFNGWQTQGWDVKRLGVLHYWVDRDRVALHQLRPEFANSVLLGAAGVAMRPPFPIPGEHCRCCRTRNCADLMPATEQQAVENVSKPS